GDSAIHSRGFVVVVADCVVAGVGLTVLGVRGVARVSVAALFLDEVSRTGVRDGFGAARGDRGGLVVVVVVAVIPGVGDSTDTIGRCCVVGVVVAEGSGVGRAAIGRSGPVVVVVVAEISGECDRAGTVSDGGVVVVADTEMAGEGLAAVRGDGGVAGIVRR